MGCTPRNASRLAALLSALLLTGLVSACDQTEPRGPGAIRVSATATSQEPVPFQFGIAIDGGTPHRTYVGLPLVFLEAGLAHGAHQITVSDAPAQCTGRDPREVTVAGDDTVSVSVTITCPRTTGDLTVTVATSGFDFDPNGYVVLVDGMPRASAPVNGSTTIRYLTAGTHTVALTDVATNCTSVGGQSVNLNAGGVASVTLSVTCARVAVLRFVASMTGPDRDPDGYAIQVDNLPAAQLRASQTLTMRVAPGARNYAIGDIQPNCVMSGSTSGAATLAAGDTVSIELAATCSAIPMGAVGVAVVDPAADTITSTYSGSTRPHDILGVTARYATGWLILVVRFGRPVISSSGFDPQALYGMIEFDVDENAGTGGPPFANGFGATASIGADYAVDLFSSDSVSSRLVARAATSFTSPGRVRTRYEGDSLIVQVPLRKLGGDDGNMALVLVVGTKDRPTDIAPNRGAILARLPGSSVLAPTAIVTPHSPAAVRAPAAAPLPGVWRAPARVRMPSRH